MSAESDATERTTVRTYVPAYQKAEWAEHADQLDMSQSEFVRTMVQAGRSGFEAAESEPDPDATDSGTGEEAGSVDETPRVDGLKDRVQEILADGEYYDWDDLLAALTDDIEERLDEALQDLQSADRVRYSGRHGGYVLDE